jgi:hypothetical protein
MVRNLGCGSSDDNVSDVTLLCFRLQLAQAQTRRRVRQADDRAQGEEPDEKEARGDQQWFEATLVHGASPEGTPAG